MIDDVLLRQINEAMDEYEMLFIAKRDDIALAASVKAPWIASTGSLDLKWIDEKQRHNPEDCPSKKNNDMSECYSSPIHLACDDANALIHTLRLVRNNPKRERDCLIRSMSFSQEAIDELGKESHADYERRMIIPSRQWDERCQKARKSIADFLEKLGVNGELLTCLQGWAEKETSEGIDELEKLLEDGLQVQKERLGN